MPGVSTSDALESSRRRQLLAFVTDNPGIHFRELSRRADFGAGAVRHHLNVLRRTGLVIERAHGATTRFFHVDASHNEDWREVVLRRNVDLATLHDWLKLNPQTSQSEVLETMSALGWARS